MSERNEGGQAFQLSCALKVFKDRRPGTHHPPLSSAALSHKPPLLPRASGEPSTTLQAQSWESERERERVKKVRGGKDESSVLYKSTSVPAHLPPPLYLPSKTTTLKKREGKEAFEKVTRQQAERRSSVEWVSRSRRNTGKRSRTNGSRFYPRRKRRGMEAETRYRRIFSFATDTLGNRFAEKKARRGRTIKGNASESCERHDSTFPHFFLFFFQRGIRKIARSIWANVETIRFVRECRVATPVSASSSGITILLEDRSYVILYFHAATFAST